MFKSDPADALFEKPKTTPYSKALNAYAEKFGLGNLCTEDVILSDEQWTEALNACVEQGIEMDEYLARGDVEPDDEI